MNILHVLDHSVPLFSGYSFRSRNIVRFQKSLGLNPIVLTSPKHGSLSDGVEEIEGIRHYRTRAYGGKGVPFFREARLMGRLRSQIRKVVIKEGIDLIHSHSPLLNGLPALWVARTFRLPLVYEARAFWEDAAVDHGTFQEGSMRYRLSRSLETVLFKRADRIVTICASMQKELIDRGIPADRITVVPNGVDVDSFQPRPPPRPLMSQFGLNGEPVFGFIGSFYHYEGLQFLLEAFPRILAQSPGAKLLLIGGGGEERLLRSMAQNLGASVIFVGQVPHDAIRDFYSLIDVFVFPRRRIRLTELVTPLKPLEAMAMGKIILASDVGGHKELIRHEETGLLFPAENLEGFLAQASRALSGSKLCAALGAAARKYVVEERTWPGLVQRYLKLYEEAATSKGQRANRKVRTASRTADEANI